MAYTKKDNDYLTQNLHGHACLREDTVPEILNVDHGYFTQLTYNHVANFHFQGSVKYKVKIIFFLVINLLDLHSEEQ